MKLEVLPGRYVVAVSGGVDSVVLFDLLRLQPGVKLTVAHFDHGIRPDSPEDRQFVQELARRYKIPVVYSEGRLGAGASEATARQARYAFLRSVREAVAADALVTAHHQDDLLETAVINLLRGTGRKGLSSLQSGGEIIRPLLAVPKSEIVDYAQRHGLVWREDSTNASNDYLRNRVRHQILPRWTAAQKKELLQIIGRMRQINADADTLLAPLATGELDRAWLATLPHDLTKELLATWLRLHGVTDFDAKMLERLAVTIKTAKAGKMLDIARGYRIRVGTNTLALTWHER